MFCQKWRQNLNRLKSYEASKYLSRRTFSNPHPVSNMYLILGDFNTIKKLVIHIVFSKLNVLIEIVIFRFRILHVYLPLSKKAVAPWWPPSVCSATWPYIPWFNSYPSSFYTASKPIWAIFNFSTLTSLSQLSWLCLWARPNPIKNWWPKGPQGPWFRVQIWSLCLCKFCCPWLCKLGFISFWGPNRGTNH